MRLVVPPTDPGQRYERLRAVLIGARMEKKITQAALGERLGKNQVWVSKYERGARQLDVIEFLDIARAIGVDPSRLIRKLEADSPAS